MKPLFSLLLALLLLLSCTGCARNESPAPSESPEQTGGEPEPLRLEVLPYSNGNYFCAARQTEAKTYAFDLYDIAAGTTETLSAGDEPVELEFESGDFVTARMTDGAVYLFYAGSPYLGGNSPFIYEYTLSDHQLRRIDTDDWNPCTRNLISGSDGCLYFLGYRTGFEDVSLVRLDLSTGETAEFYQLDDWAQTELVGSFDGRLIFSKSAPASGVAYESWSADSGEPSALFSVEYDGELRTAVSDTTIAVYAELAHTVIFYDLRTGGKREIALDTARELSEQGWRATPLCPISLDDAGRVLIRLSNYPEDGTLSDAAMWLIVAPDGKQECRDTFCDLSIGQILPQHYVVWSADSKPHLIEKSEYWNADAEILL